MRELWKQRLKEWLRFRQETPEIPAGEAKNANQVSKQAPLACYTEAMQDELEFRRAAESALDDLKRHLIRREEEAEAGFEVEEQSGVLNVVFEGPGGKFVITPNTPVRQIWISALATSFKLDWDGKTQKFVLARTGEPLIPLVDRLIGEHVAE
jgi:CyaY protein